jgi:hypothetical protein
MRVRRSAIGSVMLIVNLLPARFPHPRNLALVGKRPQAESTNAELAIDRSRTTAEAAAAAKPGRKLRFTE